MMSRFGTTVLTVDLFQDRVGEGGSLKNSAAEVGWMTAVKDWAGVMISAKGQNIFLLK